MRIGKSKQYVNQIVNGDRGPGNFPPPLTPGRWSWAVVADWLADNGLADSSLAECAKAAAVVNAALVRKEAAEESPALVAAAEAGVRAGFMHSCRGCLPKVQTDGRGRPSRNHRFFRRSDDLIPPHRFHSHNHRIRIHRPDRDRFSTITIASWEPDSR